MDSMNTLTELCEYLKNWFDDGAVYSGKITIAEGTVTCSCDCFNSEIPLENQQYFRVQGSVFDDGVHCYPDYEMTDGTFEGTITPMKIPNAVISLAVEIARWRAKYEDIDSIAMSPYTAESFKGYSYSKAGAGGNGNGTAGGWQAAFKNRLTPWRKI